MNVHSCQGWIESMAMGEGGVEDPAPDLLTTDHPAMGEAAAIALAAALATPERPPRAARLVETAIDLFGRRGFDATSVPELAAAAGVGTGTVYRYFETKEDLGNAAWQTAKRRFCAALAPAFLACPLGGAGGDEMAGWRGSFLAFWAAACAFAREHPADFRFLEFHHEPRFLDRQSLRLAEQMVAPMHGWIMGAQARGIVAPLDPEVLGALVWGALTGFIRHGADMRRPADGHSIEATGLVLWRGLCTPAAVAA